MSWHCAETMSTNLSNTLPLLSQSTEKYTYEAGQIQQVEQKTLVQEGWFVL